MSTLKALAKNWPMDHKERCKSMFNNEILSDVKFVVQASRNSENGESDSKKRKIVIPAHKLLLSICSPVFFAMFCGEMAETKEHIDLPDCEYEGMLELLRYIYTDEVCLNGNNVMQVLYLAEKYMIRSLTDECAGYIGKNLDLSNVFCVLKHAQWYENKDLLCHCWDLIDKETEEALKSNDFPSMERSFLNQLVERDTLSIREVELFKAVDCWAKEECKRQQLKADGSVKRQLLGEQIVKNIRFPIMKQRDFIDFVLQSKILTEEETRSIMNCFSSSETAPVGFLDVHRWGPLSRCCRFKSFLPDSYYEYGPNDENWLPLTVDKGVMLHGVSLLGNDGGEFTVNLRVAFFIDNEGDDVDHDHDDDDELVLASKAGIFTSKRRHCSYGYYYGFDVVFDQPIALEKDFLYFVSISVTGPGYCIANGATNVVQVSGVKFDFNPNMTDDVPQCTCAELLFKVKE
ncbi:BTB/POZ domain-containing protein 6-like [Oculina patagonica]